MANIKDFATALIATAPSPATSGTSLVLATGMGARMPAVPFNAVAHPDGQLPTLDNAEQVLVTARTTDTLTITRAQGLTIAKSIAAGWRLSNSIFAQDILNASSVTDELMTGTVNGTNKVFTTGSNFTNIQVYKNGVAMHLTDDFTVTGANQITFVTAPATGTKLTASYILGSQTMINGSSSLLQDETPTGTVNGTNTAFTTTRPYIANTLEVFINGVKQKRGTHFTETTPTSGTFTIGDAPLTGDDIMVNYQFVQSSYGNADTVDGIHASTTATANQLLALNSRAQTGEWWEELGRATLGSAGDTLTISSLVAKKYLLILVSALPSGAITPWLRFNNDSGNNYAMRYSASFGAGATLTSQSGISLDPNSTATVVLGRLEIINIATEEKSGIGLAVARGTAGAGNAPANLEVYGKWANTSNQITRVDLVNTAGAGDFAAGTELIVLGHD